MNTKQTIFVNEYLKCWNASEAARRAGYNGRSNQIGSRLLSDVDIKAEIQRRVDEITMSANEVLVRFADEGRASLALFLKPNSLEIDPAKVHEYGHLIKSLSWTANGPKIELHDSQAARIQIGRVHGLFKETQTNFNIDLTQLSDAQLQRLAAGEEPLSVLASTEGES